MSNCILEENLNEIIRRSIQRDISDDDIISLYEDAIERLNNYLGYNKFGLREGEIAILRLGGRKETRFEGFNFVLEGGETPYADPHNEDVKRYALQEKYILNLADKDSELRKEFDKKLEDLEKDAKDEESIKLIENIKRVVGEHDKENDIYTYIDVEENGLDFIIKELGFKGMLYWEYGDISRPSTYLIFDLSIVREIPKYYTLCKIR